MWYMYDIAFQLIEWRTVFVDGYRGAVDVILALVGRIKIQVILVACIRIVSGCCDAGDRKCEQQAEKERADRKKQCRTFPQISHGTYTSMYNCSYLHYSMFYLKNDMDGFMVCFFQKALT